jgi:uncharacterized paraquat-inducible protein A
MNSKQKNTALVASTVSGLFSLPLTWMTIPNAPLQVGGVVGDFFNSVFQGLSVEVTGLNGYVTVFIKTPLWFVVCIAIGASLLQLIRHSTVFAIPRLALWGTAMVAVIWTSIPVGLILITGKASVGVGWLLGIFCALVPLVCLILPVRDANAATNNVIRQSGESGAD